MDDENRNRGDGERAPLSPDDVDRLVAVQLRKLERDYEQVIRLEDLGRSNNRDGADADQTEETLRTTGEAGAGGLSPEALGYSQFHCAPHSFTQQEDDENEGYVPGGQEEEEDLHAEEDFGFAGVVAGGGEGSFANLSSPDASTVAGDEIFSSISSPSMKATSAGDATSADPTPELARCPGVLGLSNSETDEPSSTKVAQRQAPESFSTYPTAAALPAGGGADTPAALAESDWGEFQRTEAAALGQTGEAPAGERETEAGERETEAAAAEAALIRGVMEKIRPNPPSRFLQELGDADLLRILMKQTEP
eukprot:g12956.t1